MNLINKKNKKEEEVEGELRTFCELTSAREARVGWTWLPRSPHCNVCLGGDWRKKDQGTMPSAPSWHSLLQLVSEFPFCSSLNVSL